MGLFDRFRSSFGRRPRHGLDAMGGNDIRDVVEESLAETQVTSELVERAENAHERARDLMRQGHFKEALERFDESLRAWEAQAAVCREKGFKNLWKGKPLQVGKEMEDLRITHLDVLDNDSFQFLSRRAKLKRNQLARILELSGRDRGSSERDIHDAFPPEQREEVRSIVFQAERRGWLQREKIAGHYYLTKSDSAPEISSD